MSHVGTLSSLSYYQSERACLHEEKQPWSFTHAVACAKRDIIGLSYRYVLAVLIYLSQYPLRDG